MARFFPLLSQIKLPVIPLINNVAESFILHSKLVSCIVIKDIIF
jgi:hypothetical protein